MDRLETKILVIFLTWFIIAICAFLPIKVADYMTRKGKKGQEILGVISCFGGGVFFGTYLLHMAPEVRILLEESWLHPQGITYPLPELFIGIGFFVVLLLEKFVVTVNRKSIETQDKKGTVLETSISQVQLTGMVNGGLENEEFNNGDVTKVPPLENGVQINQKVEFDIKDQGNGYVVSVENQPQEDEEDTVDHSARTIILILGLSLHCIFEGMSVGLQNTTTGVWNLFIAIIAHETVIAFSVGLQLTKAYSTKGVLIGGLMYSMMTPVGIAIGTAVLETQDGTDDKIDLVNGILQGIAAGTFIYVTFLEILGDELSHDTSMGKIIALTSGFVVMGLLGLIPEEGDAIEGGNVTNIVHHGLASHVY